MHKNYLLPYVLHITQHFTTIHRVHHQAIKPIEPWNKIHTVNDSYTGFVLPRTHDTHQWLLLQFAIPLMMDAKLRPKHAQL